MACDFFMIINMFMVILYVWCVLYMVEQIIGNHFFKRRSSVRLSWRIFLNVLERKKRIVTRRGSLRVQNGQAIDYLLKAKFNRREKCIWLYRCVITEGDKSGFTERRGELTLVKRLLCIYLVLFGIGREYFRVLFAGLNGHPSGQSKALTSADRSKSLTSA